MDDQPMSDLLRDAVADVEPADRLAELRSRTAARPRRARWYAVGGAVLATAAVVTGVALAARPHHPADTTPPVSTPSPTDTAPASVHVVPVYYLGDTPRGPRLYREFKQGTGTYRPTESLAALAEPPDDPDYTSAWSTGELTGVTLRGDVIEVTVGNAGLHDRPDGMSVKAAELAVQQVVYTVQAAYGRPLPVQFVLGGNPIDQLLGVPTAEPLAQAPQLEVLALVSISDPVEGQVVSGSFTADGRAASYEGNVPWQLLDSDQKLVASGHAQASMADHLTAWQTRVDVAGLAPGTYTFKAMTDDPSGGEGPGPDVDSRTVVVR